MESFKDRKSGGAERKWSQAVKVGEWSVESLELLMKEMAGSR